MSVERRKKGIKNIPRFHIPHTDISVATSTDQNIPPGHHRPNTHHVARQRLQQMAVGVKDVDLGIVEGNYDVVRSQVKGGDNSLVRSGVPRNRLSTVPPGGLDHVPLLEMGFVGGGLRSPPLALAIVLGRDFRRKARVVVVGGGKRRRRRFLGNDGVAVEQEGIVRRAQQRSPSQGGSAA